MIVLGISALYHDAAASIVVDGKIVAAAQEERFTRKKHDPVMPVNAIRYCLKKAGIAESEPDYVVFYDNPLYTLDRYMKNMLAAGGDSRDVLERSFVSMFSEKIWIHNIIKKIFHTDRDGFQGKVLVCEHHMSHAASAFYPSPFHEAVIITMDGVGEWETTTVGIGRGKEIEIKETIYFPHSLGLLYSAFTYFCGFKVNSGDYKFMGLAPYGEPVYADIIRKNIIDIKNDGSYRLNLEYFDFQYGRTMTSKKFDDLFDGQQERQKQELLSVKWILRHLRRKFWKKLCSKQSGMRKKLMAEILTIWYLLAEWP